MQNLTLHLHPRWVPWLCLATHSEKLDSAPTARSLTLHSHPQCGVDSALSPTVRSLTLRYCWQLSISLESEILTNLKLYSKITYSRQFFRSTIWLVIACKCPFTSFAKGSYSSSFQCWKNLIVHLYMMASPVMAASLWTESPRIHLALVREYERIHAN